MAFAAYQLQTNRAEQWKLLEERMKKDGATRKNLQNCKSLFFENEVAGSFDWSDRFLFCSNPTFEGWQHLFDHELTEPLTDQDFYSLNHLLCGTLADYYFCGEDQDYYFKTTFGETFDSERLSPLRINGESQHRTLVLSENAIFSSLLKGMSAHLRSLDINRDKGLVRYNEAYLESLLPVVDIMPFMDKKYVPRDKVADGKTGAIQIQGCIKTIFEFAHMSHNDEPGKVRSREARRISSLLMDHADDLGDIRVFYDQAKIDAAKT